MENASKALLIAAGVLIGLILISLIIVGYRQISSYYIAKEESKEVEQLASFNKQYIPYNRDDVRGSDLLSLVNKIIDYNTISEEEPITISIDMNTANNIYYGGSRPSDYNLRLIDINQKYYEPNSGHTGNLEEVVQKADTIEMGYPQGKAKKLAEKLFTLTEGNTDDIEKLFNQLKLDYDPNKLSEYKNDILNYYQYMQFKRAHFDCTSLIYTEQGRVESFKFEFNGKFE